MILLVQKEENIMENYCKVMCVIELKLNELKDSYETWLTEYDRTGSVTSEEQLIQTKQKILLLEEILREIGEAMMLDPDKRYDE